jgi:uncharacterized protein (TIGR02145 family)
MLTLNDEWLIAQPDHERIVVLTCVVTAAACEYVVSKEIRVGDRDCCARLTDADNVIYSAVRFGDAGCWMTENLAVTKNQKLGSAANLMHRTVANPPTTSLAPQFTRPNSAGSFNPVLYSVEQAQSSDYIYGSGVGKLGMLYNWAAAVGATSTDAAQNQTIYPSVGSKDELGDASNSNSKNEDICPFGWYLPSDAEWYAVENEISLHPSTYSSSTVATGGPVAITNEIPPPGNHGLMMRFDFNGIDISKPKESGFNIIDAGHAYNGDWSRQHTHFWSSSAYGTIYAWERYLTGTQQGVTRYASGSLIFNKRYLFSVRCKKLDN